MMTKAVIFDLYGTVPILRTHQVRFLKLAQRTADVRSALQLAMTTDNSTLTHFASRIGLELPDDLLSLEVALSADIVAIQPFVDVKPTLLELKARGIKTAIISNLASPISNHSSDTNWTQIFDVVVFSCDCGITKPDTRIYEHALRNSEYHQPKQ